LLGLIFTAGCNRSGNQAEAKGPGAGKKGGGDVPVTVAKVVQREVPVDLCGERRVASGQ